MPGLPCPSSATNTLCDFMQATLSVWPQLPSVERGDRKVWLGSGKSKMLLHLGIWTIRQLFSLFPSLACSPYKRDCHCCRLNAGLSQPNPCPGKPMVLCKISPVHICP